MNNPNIANPVAELAIKLYGEIEVLRSPHATAESVTETAVAIEAIAHRLATAARAIQER